MDNMRDVAAGEYGKKMSELSPSTFATHYYCEITTTKNRIHVAQVTKVRFNVQLVSTKLQFCYLSTINPTSAALATGQR